MAHLSDWRHWVYGLVAAFIGGAANAVTLVIVDPLDFNLDTGLKQLGMAALVSGIVSLAMYLKQAPVPPEA